MPAGSPSVSARGRRPRALICIRSSPACGFPRDTSWTSLSKRLLKICSRASRLAGVSSALCFLPHSANICRPCAVTSGGGQAADLHVAEHVAQLRRQIGRAAGDRLAHRHVAQRARQRQALVAGEEAAAQVFRLAALGVDGAFGRSARHHDRDRVKRVDIADRGGLALVAVAQRLGDVGFADLQRGRRTCRAPAGSRSAPRGCAP